MPLLAWIPGIHCIPFGFGLQQTPFRDAKNNKSSSKHSNLLLICYHYKQHSHLWPHPQNMLYNKGGQRCHCDSRKQEEGLRDLTDIKRREHHHTLPHTYVSTCSGLDMWFGLNAEQLLQLTWYYFVVMCWVWELPGYLTCHSDVPVTVKTRVDGWVWRSSSSDTLQPFFHIR